MKKILHIANTDKMLQNFRLEFLQRLQSIDYEIHICAASYHISYRKELENEGFIFHEVKMKRGLNPINALKAVFSVKKIINKYDFKIIHTHTPTGGLIGRLAARLAKHKSVFHTTAGFYFHENMPKRKYNFYAGLERFLAKKTQVIFSPNYEDIETCKRLKITPIYKIAYCGPTGVDLIKFNPKDKDVISSELKTQYQIDSNTVIVGLVARLETEKGYIEFVDVAHKLLKDGKNVQALSIGEGRDGDIINEHISKNNITNVTFLGHSREVPKLMQLFDILLFPSYREGLPIVTLEAMALKIPIVAYDIRGCRESIVDTETGFLVPFKDNEALLRKTKELVEDRALREQMGQNGRKRVEQYFTKEMHIERQLPFYSLFDK